MLAFQPETIAIEAVYRGQYRSVDRAFGAVHSAIWCAAQMVWTFSLAEPLKIRPPKDIIWIQGGQMRKALELPKSATKADMAERVSGIYGLKTQVMEDITDAIAVAHAHKCGMRSTKRTVLSSPIDIQMPTGKTLYGLMKEVKKCLV